VHQTQRINPVVTKIPQASRVGPSTSYYSPHQGMTTAAGGLCVGLRRADSDWVAAAAVCLSGSSS
jgi:hypothetical protein